MAASRMQNRLKGLISHISSPALLVNTTKHKVLGNNPSAVSKYGQAVATGHQIVIHGEIGEDDSYQAKLRAADDLFEVELILDDEDEDEGDFEITMHSKSIAIFVENVVANADMLKLPPESSYCPSFHFSYMHRILTNKRTYPNPQELRRLGLVRKSDDAAHLNWRDLILLKDRDNYDKSIATALEHGGNHRLRYRVRGVDGQIHELTDFFSVIRDDGMWPILSGTIVSTEGVQEKMQQVERLCLVGRLVGGMIHDFRNLLGGVQNMLEWCMAQSPPESNVFKAMSKTINYTDQANGLIRTTLRLLDGKGDGDDERIKVGELLTDVEGLIRHFGSSTIDIKVSFEDDLPPLWGQRSSLLDMLLNLGLNACDAMKEEGDLLIFEASKKGIADEWGTPEDHISFRIIDNGCGMPEDVRQAIFNEFFTTKKNGAGLGLWMVKEAARSFGGTVRVTSKVGAGATFEVLLPVPKGIALEEIEEKKDDLTGTVNIQEIDFLVGKKVLFIEDEPLLRNGVQVWLETMGFDVFVAADGTEGKYLFEQHQDELDLIIQDFILPGIRGEVLLDMFTAEKPELPVIVCSGYPDGRDYSWIEDRGAHAFLSKPFRIERLVDIFRGLFAEQGSIAD
ncbi:hypothetical protein BVY04_02245 [bacterium M21]|nr:hypothetical protein BVY04_02245 [bacterium M21]